MGDGWWSRREWSSSATVSATENEEFAAHAASQATDLVVVGVTNRRALVDGAGRRRAPRYRGWFATGSCRMGPGQPETGDAVLYENDLPDHYP